MQIRNPVVAGQFYPAQRDDCIGEINECLAQRSLSRDIPEKVVAGIVPHAGWVFSGGLAAMVFRAIKQRHETVDTFVIFGAAHSFFGPEPAIFDKGCWRTPLGDIFIDEQLAESLLKSTQISCDTDAHKYEHSIEVQIPFIQYLFANARIVPVLVGPESKAISLGRSIAEIISSSDKKIVCIGSTDLTHYGPHYGFEPMGPGQDALQWASEVNDKKFIDAAVNLDAEQILSDVRQHQNACGAPAAAATVAAAKKLGKTQGVVLAHTSSSEIMLQKMGQTSDDSVGYASIVY